MHWLRLTLLFVGLNLLNSCTFNKIFYATGYQKDLKMNTQEVECQEFYLKVNKRDSLHCAYFNKVDSSKGLVVYLHGNAGSVAESVAVADFFNKYNYNCLLVDYLGYGSSSGKATHRSFFKSGRRIMEYLRSLKHSGPLILYGFSIGGHLSVTLANENQDLVDLLLIEGRRCFF